MIARRLGAAVRAAVRLDARVLLYAPDEDPVPTPLAQALSVVSMLALAPGTGTRLAQARLEQDGVADAAAITARAIAPLAPALGQVVLVNNAGIIRDNLIFKMTEGDWDAVMAVHLKGAFLMTRACQAHMTAQKYGRIVNLSSSSAQGNRGQANYSAAKAGLQGFTKTLAIELGRFGVTANAVAPGFIQTDMTAATAQRIGVPFEEFLAHAASQVPVQRVGQPEDIAATIAFLVSQEAGFVSGQVIYVAGGPLD